MLDARKIYRKVTRKIYDFSPEQEQNLLAIVSLYRGDTDLFLGLVSQYLRQVVHEGQACFEWQNEDGEPAHLLPEFTDAITTAAEQLDPFLMTQPQDGPYAETLAELAKERKLIGKDVRRFEANVKDSATKWEEAPDSNTALNALVTEFAPLAESSRDLIKQTDLLYKLVTRLIAICEDECDARESKAWFARDVIRVSKEADKARQSAVEQLRQVRYFWRQAHWLTERFPEARLRDVEGLVKLVDRAEIEANDWSLTPSRYVGVAPEEEEEDFDFEAALHEIHVELEDLNSEAVSLAATIKKNFAELGV